MAITFPTVFQSAITTDPAATAAGYLTPTRYNTGCGIAGLSATAGALLYSTSATVLAQSTGLLWNTSGAAGEGLAVAPVAAATTAVSALSISQTWNNAAIDFTGVGIDITKTAFGGNSIGLRVGPAFANAAGTQMTATFASPTGLHNYLNMNAPSGFTNWIGFYAAGSRVGEISVASGTAYISLPGACNFYQAGTIIHTLTSTALQLGPSAHTYISATAPTVASGFGTSPSIASNGTATFRLTVGTGGTDSTGVITMPAASAGWNAVIEVFNPSGTNLLQDTAVTASGTTSITMTNYTISTGLATAWPAGTVLIIHAMAY